MENDEIVTIARFTRAVDAHLARALLEQEGIPVIVAGDTLINLSLYHAIQPELVQLQVRACDAERAAQLLAAPPEPLE